jgi:hypothetical protein
VCPRLMNAPKCAPPRRALVKDHGRFPIPPKALENNLACLTKKNLIAFTILNHHFLTATVTREGKYQFSQFV